MDFAVDAGPGAYLELEIEPRGIDATVRLLAPDGDVVVEVASLEDTQAPAPVTAVTDRGGRQLLQVRGDGSGGRPGSVALRLAALRSAAAGDRERVAGDRLLAAGTRLYRRRTGEGFREALESYRRGLAVFAAAGDLPRQAVTLHAIGSVHKYLSQPREALEAYSQARAKYQQAGDPQGAALVLNYAASIHLVLGDADAAAADASQALAELRRLGDRQGEAAALNNLGQVYRRTGRPGQALEVYRRALTCFQEAGDRQGEATVLNGIGLAADGLGRPQMAIQHYERALPLFREVGDRQGEAVATFNLGLIYEQLGEMERVRRAARRVLRLAREMGNRRLEASALQGLATVALRTGDHREALELHRQELAIFREIGDRQGEAAGIRNVGQVRADLMETTAAEEAYREALALYRQMGHRPGEAQTLSLLGDLRRKEGDPGAALELLGRALASQRQMGDRQGASRTLARMARAHRDRGELSAARARVGEAIDLAETLRADVARQDLRTSSFSEMRGDYELYVDLEVELDAREPQAGHGAAALAASERARARLLLETLSRAGGEIHRGISPTLRRRDEELTAAVDRAEKHLGELFSCPGGLEQVAAAEEELSGLLDRLHDLEARIAAESPGYAALTRPRILGLREIQRQVLDSETVLLEYLLGAERSFVWAVTASSSTVAELPARGVLEPAAERLVELLTARGRRFPFETEDRRRERIREADGEVGAAAGELSRLLLGPVAERLRGVRRLLVVADGALQAVPFAALPEPGAPIPRPLIVDHEVVYLPSASVAAVLRQIPRAGGGPAATDRRRLAILADPVYDAGDPRVRRPAAGGGGVPPALPFEAPAGAPGSFERLPATRQEAAAIASMLPPEDRFVALGFAASRETLLSAEVRQARILHLATHAVLDPRWPALSGVVLSLVDGRGQPRNGFLRLHEIYDLDLAADLVVLSACDTALGKEVPGEGLMGLARGFMYAGTPAVVATLWSSSDAATAELMRRFYREMLERGLPPAAALRQAQVGLWRQGPWRHLYYWAAFGLYGDWQARGWGNGGGS